MEIICKIPDDINSVLSEQDYNDDIQYKSIIYHKAVFINDNVLLYNSLTRELLLLSYNEYSEFCSGANNEFLVKHWFLVPDDIDENTILYMFNKSYQVRFPRKRYGKFQLCTIITTTDCNARCPYCYQQGIKRKYMSNKVALDVAKYIVPRASDNVTLNWFGGEPLYNSDAIDTICNYFNDNNINFKSTMISNGYLIHNFSPDVIVNKWKLKQVQITLDGTEEIYNSTKKFIYNNENPFKVVTDNIEYLLQNNIRVNIRLNLSPKNINNMFVLVDWINTRYKDKSNLGVYSKVLFDKTFSDINSDERNKLYEKHIELQQKLKDLGLFGNFTSTPKIKRCHCMADDGRSTVINTEGDLSLCEHFIDSELYGSIYGGEIHRDILTKFSKRQDDIPECKTCFYKPQCFRLKMCIPESSCDEEFRKINEWQTTEMMKDLYKKYIAEKGLKG